MAFNNIIGNDDIKNILIKSLKNKTVLHSYMFIGNEGIGKKLMAIEFAKMILCDEYDFLNKSECEKCKSCIEFNSGNNPDYMYIEPDGKVIKIEQIREMQNKIIEKPVNSNKKVYIINNAETMTKEAQNCLLKTLEEPPEYITIILIVNNESKMLTTIKSRCMKLQFQKISDENIKSILIDETKKVSQSNTEKKSTDSVKNISKDNAESIYSNNENNNFQCNINEDILKLCDGSIGKAYKIREKIEGYAMIEELMKNVNQNLIRFMSFSDILYSNKDEILEYLDYINVILYRLVKENSSNGYKYIKSIEIVEETKQKLAANRNYDMCIDMLLFGIWEEINEKNS